MTREEAIQWLKVISKREFGWDEFALQESQREIRERCVREAIDMAIEALSADAVQGEWIECLAYNPDLDADVLYIECAQCGHRPYFSGSYRPKYCEECGARMTKGGDTE